MASRHSGPSGSRLTWTLAIIFFSACLGILADWRAPGLDRYSRDWLMRARGPLPVPDDIALVAIDEPSIARFGRFPWPRTLTAQAIDKIAAAQPKVIALDILYTDPTTPADDQALAQSLAHASNAVVAAQLIESPNLGGPVSWLLPIPLVQQSAASTGHVNVTTESEGVARQILIDEADDTGHRIRSMAVEAVRIGDGTPPQAVAERPHSLQLGARTIPVTTPAPSLVISPVPGSAHPPQILRTTAMAIDYLGPTGSFGPHTYSFGDVIDGKVPPQDFRNKYVLAGATAASLGDRLASPFVHQPDAADNQHGALMPGVEVLANAVNTILRGRFYTEVPDWLVFLIALGVAAATAGLLNLAQGLKQLAVLAIIAASILAAAYLAITYALIFPPLVPATVSFASAGLLALIRRSLIASARLDAGIHEISRAGQVLAPAVPGGAAETVARLTGATGAAIHSGDRLIAAHGKTAGAAPTVRHPLRHGWLALTLDQAHPPDPETLRLCAAIAESAILVAEDTEKPGPAWLPAGIESKARALTNLNQRIVHRARFIDSALKSVEDGLLIATADGRVTFANMPAAAIFGVTVDALMGCDLLDRLGEPPATLRRLLIDRASTEREIIAGPRHYTLRLAPVESEGAVLGLVATLSDVTRQHDLRQTQQDVMALVSHEMRTPLTAIQGMSELLAEFELDPTRRRELNLTINEEVKRLSHMINDYLDLARLESGVTPLRKSPVRIQTLVERVLLLMDRIALQKNIRLRHEFQPDTPAILADPELLARAIQNLVSNAIKYSPNGTEVLVTATPAPGGGACIEVTDQGYGIPAADLTRIFEKFYRVPRVQDAGVPGTGLGLSLVRDIAELHGGSVTVRSKAGEGSTFSFLLPA